MAARRPGHRAFAASPASAHHRACTPVSLRCFMCSRTRSFMTLRGLKRASSARTLRDDESAPPWDRAPRLLAGAVLLACGLGAATHVAEAGPIFSVSWQGPPKGLPSFFGPPIAEGDLLIVATPTFTPMPGPLPPPIV